MSRLLPFVLIAPPPFLPSSLRAADEKKALDGTWTVVKAEADGKPENEVLGASFTFADGDKLVIKLAKDDKPLDPTAVKLDAAAKPKQIDLTAQWTAGRKRQQASTSWTATC